MGYRQSMVVLSRGDWVMTRGGKVGWVSVPDYIDGYALVEFGNEYKGEPCYPNNLMLPEELTPLPEGLTPLLLSSNSTGETK